MVYLKIPLDSKILPEILAVKSELAEVGSLFTASYVPSENQDDIQISMYFLVKLGIFSNIMEDLF